MALINVSKGCTTIVVRRTCTGDGDSQTTLYQTKLVRGQYPSVEGANWSVVCKSVGSENLASLPSGVRGRMLSHVLGGPPPAEESASKGTAQIAFGANRRLAPFSAEATAESASASLRLDVWQLAGAWPKTAPSQTMVGSKAHGAASGPSWKRKRSAKSVRLCKRTAPLSRSSRCDGCGASNSTCACGKSGTSIVPIPRSRSNSTDLFELPSTATVTECAKFGRIHLSNDIQAEPVGLTVTLSSLCAEWNTNRKVSRHKFTTRYLAS
mmetsp:Transcript_18963/g.54947  ORF Transcript_18963/g.54947 Transcript_18963/m.54947 type:complete len:267 (+) Transcript_18963:161-961(+)